jgi:hypothetical protein
MSQISKQALKVDNSQSFPNNNVGAISPSDLRDYNVNVIDSLVDEITYQSDSGSWNNSIDALEAFTSSQQPAFTALNAFTASQLNINSGVNSFTQSAGAELDSLSAWTGSWNDWTSSINEIRDNGVLQGYSTRFFFEGLVSASITQNVNGPIATINVEQDGTKFSTASYNAYTASTAASQSLCSSSVATSINALNQFSTSLDTNFVSEVEFSAYSSSVSNTINALSDSTGAFATTGSNTFVGNQTINANADINGDLFVSGTTNLGFVNIADNGGINLECSGSGPVTSYGIVTNPSNGDFVINNNPGNGRLMTFTQTDARAQIWGGLYLNRIDGGGGVVMTTHSGSMFLTPSGQSSTTESVLHVTSSSPVNNVNLLFKPNNNAVSTIVSGSSNIFTNVAAPTAGFVRYMSGGNISVGGSGTAVPQISSSMAFSPTISNNYFGVSNNPLTIKGPISASAYNLNNNVIGGGSVTFGPGAVQTFERAVSGLNFNNNIVNGTINAISFKTPLSASVNIVNNNIGGTVTLNMDSSSINIVTSTIQGSLTVNNSYLPNTVTSVSGQFGITSLLNVGPNFIFASGSNTTFTGAPRTIIASSMLGGFNMMSASLNGDNSQINATHLIGQGLVAVGTNSRPAGLSAADWGSVFVGRWNDISGAKDTTAETVFAVGAGTSNTNRRTALLIDSGSNTFVEGSLTITGSVYGNVFSASIISNTASIDLSVANYFTLTLPISSSTNINVLNPKPGNTAILRITTAETASVIFSSNVLQPTGSRYSPTNGVNTDILTLSAFDSSNVYIVSANQFS